MAKSNDGQYAKAKKEFGKDFFSSKGSSSDSGLEKDATRMEKGSIKAGRFAAGGAMRQPRDGNMKFASGGFPKKAPGKNPFGKKPKPEDAMAMTEEKTMTKGFPRNKAAKFASGGAAKPVKRNMGGMMGSGMQPPVPPPVQPVGAPGIGGQSPVPGMAPQFRKGGAARPVKLAMGGVGKQRHGQMSKSGAPTSPRKASKVEQVI